jgi:hypothetical protein
MQCNSSRLSTSLSGDHDIPRCSIHVETFAMEHAVKVGSIPTNIQFPVNLGDRIRFEPSRQKLVFRGFMSKSEYDQLMRLSQDAQYQSAVSELFQLSTDTDSPQLRQFGRVLTILTIACLLLAALVWWSLLRNTSPGNHGMPPATSAVRSAETERAAQDQHPSDNEVEPGRNGIIRNRV